MPYQLLDTFLPPPAAAAAAAAMDYSIDRVSYRRSASRLTIGAHLFGILAIILLLVWLLHYRDGIEYDSDDPHRVFNVLIGESPSSPISYKRFNLLKKMNSNEWILEINYCSCLHRFTHFLCSAGLCSLPVKVRTFLLILPNPTMLTNHCFSYKFLTVFFSIWCIGSNDGIQDSVCIANSAEDCSYVTSFDCLLPRSCRLMCSFQVS